jgi:NAD(P)H dehydrogenase (quinone)
MIVLTGATGKLGRLVVERLLPVVGPGGLAVSVRDPAKAADLAALGVRVRRGDFTDPASLVSAFEGADQVLLVSGPADPAPHRAAILAARDAGAQRIVYTSHAGVDPDSQFVATRGHAATERDLAESGVPFTALRNGFYATSARWMMGRPEVTGEILLPADGPVHWTAHTDLADAAVIALTAPERLSGPTAPLTGPQALDFDDIAALVSDLIGRTVVRTVVSDDEYLASLHATGVPAEFAELGLGIFRASRRGEFATVDPTLGELLGREPVKFEDLLRAETAD